MNKIWLVFVHELRILRTDRQALGLLFFMPLAFIVFLTLALQDVYLAKVGQRIHLQVVSADTCGLCPTLVEQLRRYPYDLSLAHAASDDVEISLILPAHLEQTVKSLEAGEPLAADQQIQLIFDPTLDRALRAVVESHLELALQAVMIDQVKTRLQEVPQLKNALPELKRFDGLVQESARGGVVLPNPIQQTVPAWALFGMFFIVIPMANSMIRDRRLGIFKRLLSFPVNKLNLLCGKIGPFLAINILQFAMMFTVGIFVLPRLTHLNLDLNFDFAALLWVTFASSLAATAYGLMVSVLANTTEQASAFGALSVVILAILGGVMVPRVVMPPFMQQLAKVSPMYWALESYHDVLVRHAVWQVWLSKVALLLGFALICATISLFRFRWNRVD